MNSEIILIKDLTRIKDNGQSFIQFRIDEPHPHGPCIDYRVENYRYKVQDCQVRRFVQINDDIEKSIQFVFSPKVEKEFEIIFETIDDQDRSISDLSDHVLRLQCEIQRVTVFRDRLWVRLDEIKSMSFWKRIKFAFTGKADQ